MKNLIIIIWKKIMQIIYTFFKLFKTQNKVLFMSRQTNDKQLDFNLIIEELQKQDPDVKIKVLNKRLEKGIKSKISYGFHMFIQMYHLATSKVVIIDSYSILVCILKHKKDLKIIQIWHALGSLKKFGYSILDRKEGRSSKLAKIMNMHMNYDYVLSSSKVSSKYFMEAFNVKKEQMLILGLPRIDFLQSKEYQIKTKEEFYRKYSECDNKKENILYVPTYREGKGINLKTVIDSINFDKYNLIVKTHDGKEKIYVDNKKIEKGIFFLGIELLHVSDYIITDYSAIIYEAALVKKPIYLYAYDLDEYVDNRGFYINYKKEMPGFISKDINKIMKKIESREFDLNKIENFTNKYIEIKNKNATIELVNVIINLLNNKTNF